MENTTSFEETLNAALQFLIFAHKPDTQYAGTIFFTVNDQLSGQTIRKSVRVTPSTVQIVDGYPPDGKVDCSVMIAKDTLLAIVSGSINPMVAFMCGQVMIDNPMVMPQFAQVFDLSPQKLEEFKATLESNRNPPTETNTPIPTTPTATNEKQESTVNEVNTPTINPSSNSSPVIIQRSGRNVETILAVGFLQFLQSLRTFAIEMDKQLEVLKATPNFQRFATYISDTKKNIQESQTFQSIQSSPALNTIIGNIATEMRAQRIPETFQDYKTKALQLSTGAMSLIIRAASGNVQSPTNT